MIVLGHCACGHVPLMDRVEGDTYKLHVEESSGKTGGQNKLVTE